MAEKPSYLKLLNGISSAETRAFQYLSAWADVTTDPDVRAVLHTVATVKASTAWRSPSGSTSWASS